MANSSGFRNRCPNCGYWLAPNQTTCPECGRKLQTFLLRTNSGPNELAIRAASGKRNTSGLEEILKIRDKMYREVLASGTRAFIVTHSTLPQNWSEIADMITDRVTNKLPEILPPVLEKHEREREARESSLTSQLKKIITDTRNPATWFWIIVSAIVSAFVVYLVFGHT